MLVEVYLKAMRTFGDLKSDRSMLSDHVQMSEPGAGKFPLSIVHVVVVTSPVKLLVM